MTRTITTENIIQYTQPYLYLRDKDEIHKADAGRMQHSVFDLNAIEICTNR